VTQILHVALGGPFDLGGPWTLSTLLNRLWRRWQECVGTMDFL